ncbi:MAG TPA: glycosyltransferase [Propionibacteriaceae bacterium]|nr:glycosyltransferase [Propionibacteriaceae bacterium]
MRVLIWHVHGGWMESFVRGDHDYLLPVNDRRDGWGLGRGGRDWPNAREVRSESLADEPIDVVVLQRPDELDECLRLTGRRPGHDLPAVYLEHNTPKDSVPSTVHPLADQSEIPIVHVTHFNDVMWDSGRATTRVVEHGIVDHGAGYTGERPVQAVVVNEPVRRWRVTGTDLLPAFADAGPLELYGMGCDALPEALGMGTDRLRIGGDLPPAELRRRLGQCRLYVHPLRWTSLGLALLEAMHLALPVVVLASTEAARAVPPGAGAISTDVTELVAAARRLLNDPEEAQRCGRVAREAALARYGLGRFLTDWDGVLHDVVGRRPRHRKIEGGAP